MEIQYKCGIGGCCFLIMNLFLHWNWRRSWRKLSCLAVFAKWTYGMLSAAYYSCLSIFFSFFRPDTELVIVVLGYEGRHFAVPARLSSCHIAPEEVLMMVFPATPTASQEASPTKYPLLTRCSYKVLRSYQLQFKYLLMPLPLYPVLIHPCG